MMKICILFIATFFHLSEVSHATEVNALIDEHGSRKAVRYMTDVEAKQIVKAGGCLEKFPSCSMHTKCVCNAGDPSQLLPEN